MNREDLIGNAFICQYYVCTYRLLLMFLRKGLFSYLNAKRSTTYTIQNEMVPLNVTFTRYRSTSIARISKGRGLFALVYNSNSFSRGRLVSVSMIIGNVGHFTKLGTNSFRRFFNGLLPIRSDGLLTGDRVVRVLPRMFSKSGTGVFQRLFSTLF